MRLRVLIPCSLLVPSLAAAQAPRITPAGDPSVRNDTIYALAVDSTQHRGERFVYLLDDGVVQLEPDGRKRESYRQVVQVLTPEAAKAWAEQSFSYAPDRERFTLNWLRVVKPSGEVVSAKPVVQQEADVPAESEAPVYQRRRVLRVSLGPVAPGMLIDWSTTRESKAPPLRGDFRSAWSTVTGALTRRSRLLVDVPEDYTPTIVEYNLPAPRTDTVAHGRRVYRWIAQEVPRPPRRQMFAADSSQWSAGVLIGGKLDWDAVAGWYSGLAAERARMTPALEVKLASLLEGARSRADSLHAVHRWVAQDIRYVSVALGLGGYQPRAAGEVLASGVGDCKDKATLLITLLGRMGVPAYPVLVQAGMRRRVELLPSIEAFNHAIVAIPESAGYHFVDPTAELIPFDALPVSDQGEFGLVVHPDGRGEPVTLPLAPPSANRLTTVLRGTVNDSGYVHARLELTAGGSMETPFRAVTAERLDSTRQAEFTRRLGEMMPFAKSDSLQLFDGKDLGAEPRIAFVLDGGKLVTLSGPTAVMSMQGLGANARRTLEELASEGPRQYPIDIAKVAPPVTVDHEYDLTLPPGWQATLPADLDTTGPFGHVMVTYRQTGRELSIHRIVEGAMGVLPPEQAGDLTKWFEALARDDATALVITRSGGGGAAPKP
jgi:transglutaminase-like putative cysteine protease